jgi:O-antigen/teichoic acid export membrane protein
MSDQANGKGISRKSSDEGSLLSDAAPAKGQFLGHTITMSKGVLLAQVVPLLVIPILTRFYTPSDYGYLASILTVSGVISVMATARFELAIVLARDDAEASTLAKATLALIVGTIGVFAAGLCVISAFEGGVLSPRVVTILAWAIAIGGLIALLQLCEGLANRHRAYSVMANTTAARVLATSGIALVLGLFGNHGSGLLIGTLLGYAIVLVRYREILGRDVFSNWARIDVKNLCVPMRRAWQFPVYNAPVSILQTASRDLLILALMATQQASAAGHFSVARTIVNLPANWLSGALSAIYYREAVSQVELPTFAEFTLKLTKAIVWLLVPGFTWVCFWSGDILGMVLGEAWRPAGLSIEALSVPAFLLSLISWPNRLFEVRAKQHWQLSSQALFDSLAALLLLAAVSTTGSPILMLWLFSAALTGTYLTFLFLEHRLVGIPIGATFRVLRQAAIIGAGMWLIGFGLNLLGWPNTATLVIHGLAVAPFSAIGARLFYRVLAGKR